MGLPEAQAGVISGAGAGEGFEAFYVREYHAVVRLAYALSGSRLAAEDIAQEAFLRAFRDWEKIRSPSAWVRKVAGQPSASARSGPPTRWPGRSRPTRRRRPGWWRSSRSTATRPRWRSVVAASG